MVVINLLTVIIIETNVVKFLPTFSNLLQFSNLSPYLKGISKVLFRYRKELREYEISH